MAIQLITFGGLRAADDGSELHWLLAQHSRAALFVYLALERRVQRESLTAIFWPESDTESARHALRQSLYQLRKTVGSEWVDSRAHELVVTGEIRCDALDFTHALEQGDLDSAVRLYTGPFLDGVHLVDLKPWENWVDARRAQYARSFRKACRELCDAKQTAGDPTGAIEVAERWAARDPGDDEAQHRLIAALATAGERTGAIRQYEIYERVLAADGLSPLDETMKLADHLRSNASRFPESRHASIAPPQHAPAIESSSTKFGAEAGPAPVVRPIPIRPRLAVVAIVALTLVFASAFVWRRWRAEVSPLSSVVAVLPFSARGEDGVGPLGDGIVNLLGAALDGADSLRPVDARAVFAAVADAGGVVRTAQTANGVATRLGAGMYVLGDVIQAGNRLQIEAAIYRVGRADPSTRAVVSGAADSVFALVDRLAAQLLGELGHPAADRLVRTASVTTASLPAFKAYLHGEALMRAGQFERAAEAYGEAIERDSTFAVAHYRLGLAREWAPLPGEADAANAAARHSARLSPRDRRLLDAFREWRSGRAVEAERAYRAILARYPDDVDAWFQLGEIEFHHGPLLGRPLAESENAWRKVLSYEPRNLFALIHLGRIAVIGRRVAALDSLLAAFTKEELRTDRRLVELVVLRAMATGNTSAADTLARSMRSWEGLSVWRVAVFVSAFTPDPLMTSTIVRHMADGDNMSPALRADVRWFASLLDLAGGRAHAAQRSLADAAESERGVSEDRRRQRFDAVTEWFAATLPLPYPDSMLTRVRDRAASLKDLSSSGRVVFESETGLGSPIQLEPLRQYTIGVLSLRLRDTTSAADASARLRRLAASSEATMLTRDLDRGLRAHLAVHSGRSQVGLDLLQATESRDAQGEVAATPFASRANERFLRAEVLASLGRTAEAVQWLAALGDGSVSEIALRAPSVLRQGELYERLGRRDEAIARYQRFVELWKDADPSFQQPVAEATRRLATLRRP